MSQELISAGGKLRKTKLTVRRGLSASNWKPAGATVLHLPAVDLQHDTVGRLRGGKSDRADDQTLGCEGEGHVLQRFVLKVLRQAVGGVQEAWLTGHHHVRTIGNSRLNLVTDRSGRTRTALRSGVDLRRSEFKTALAVGQGGETIVGGRNQGAGDRLMRHAVDHNAADGAGVVGRGLRGRPGAAHAGDGEEEEEDRPRRYSPQCSQVYARRNLAR